MYGCNGGLERNMQLGGAVKGLKVIAVLGVLLRGELVYRKVCRSCCLPFSFSIPGFYSRS
jgi:hypothetical protein